MPPKNSIRGQRGGGGGNLKTSSTGSVASVAQAASSPLQNCGTNADARHNTDQPCCQHLTDLALRIFPVASSSGSASTTKEKATASSPTASDPAKSLAFHTLLREYLLEERRQRIRLHKEEQQQQADSSASNKKKRKKKKKKKSNGAPSVSEDREEDDSNEATNDTELIIESSATTAVSPALAEPPSPQTPTRNGRQPHGSTNGRAPSKVDPVLLTREQTRQVCRLIDRFLAQHNDRTIPTNSCATSASVDLSLLREFIGTITDSDQTWRNGSHSDTPGTTPMSTPPPPPSSRGGAFHKELAPIALIPLERVQAAVRAIQCSKCRKDVERVLLPSSASAQQYERKIWLRGVQVPTIYDVYQASDDHDLESKTAEYQLLMEEGIEPPEHSQAWSLTLVSRFGSPSNGGTTAKILGWELRRPKALLVPQPLDDCMEPESAPASHWAMHDLDLLLQHYVLLSGLSPDVVTGADRATFDPQLLSSIAADVSERTNASAIAFKNMAEDVLDAIQSRPSIESLTADNVNWTGYPSLEKANATCDAVLEAMLNTALQVTLSVKQFVGNVSCKVEHTDTFAEADGEAESRDSLALLSDDDFRSETYWAVALCQNLWHSFIDTLLSIIASVDNYHQKLCDDIAHRTGSFPDMFNSPPSRVAFNDLVDAKVHATVIAVQNMEATTQHPTTIGYWKGASCTSSTSTFLARIWTEEAFSDRLNPSSSQTPSKCERLDETWRDVLVAIREMTKVDQKSRCIADLVSEKRQRYDKLSILLAAVVGAAGDLLSDVSCEDNMNDHRESSVLSILAQEVQGMTLCRPNYDEEAGSRDNELKAMSLWFTSLRDGFLRATDYWVGYRRCNKTPSCDQRIQPVMPNKLRRSMIPGSSVLDDTQESCRGGDGQLRSSCILVGLFLEHVGESFKEWQAQRAAQELLTTMEQDDGSAFQVTSKANKKNRKKAPKKAPSASEKKAATLDSNDVDSALRPGILQPIDDCGAANGTDASELQQSGSAAASGLTAEETSPVDISMPESVEPSGSATASDLTAEETLRVEISSSESVEEKLEDPAMRTETAPHQNGFGVAFSGIKSDTSEDPASMPSDAPPTTLAPNENPFHDNGATTLRGSDGAGVYDDRSNGFQEAETFLVGRLLALLEAKEDLLLVH
jgi:hypothetical protein